MIKMMTKKIRKKGATRIHRRSRDHVGTAPTKKTKVLRRDRTRRKIKTQISNADDEASGHHFMQAKQHPNAIGAIMMVPAKSSPSK